MVCVGWLAGWLVVFVSPGKDTNSVINCNLIAGSYLLSFCLIYKADICVRIIIICANCECVCVVFVFVFVFAFHSFLHFNLLHVKHKRTYTHTQQHPLFVCVCVRVLSSFYIAVSFIEN